MSFKGVIFDLDGVIVSTDKFHYEAWNQLAEQEGIEFSKEINHRLRGISRRESLEILLEKATKTYSEAEIEKMLETKNEVYRKSLGNLSKDEILPGIIKLIAFLRNENIMIAVGSSSNNARTILKQIGLENSFDAIVDGNDITKSIPDPEVFLKSAKAMRIKPRDCLVVENDFAGIHAAKRAGMYAVAVSDALKCREADFFANDILDIKNLF